MNKKKIYVFIADEKVRNIILLSLDNEYVKAVSLYRDTGLEQYRIHAEKVSDARQTIEYSKGVSI